MREPGLETWAFEEFGRLRSTDPRWRRRLVQMAARAAHGPAGRVTEVFGNDAERQGAYGLLESESVDAEAVGASMFEACARRSTGESFVFCPVDGTSLTLTDRQRCKDFGPVGSRARGAVGLKVMNAMVLSPEGVPLGISAQRWWTRAPQRRRTHRDHLRPEQKETGRWLEAIRQTKQVMATHAPKTRCWFQLDREGDAWPILMEADLGDSWFTIRSCRNRFVLLPGGKRMFLRELLSQQPVNSEYTLEVRGTPKRQARNATMAVRSCRVTIQLRDKRTGERFPMDLNVVQAVEQGTTPRSDEPIEWTLLTNRPIQTTRDLTDVILGYSMRWRIEELHRTWKSGACAVEDTQLRTTSAVAKWATILIAVAVRIERIKQLSRVQPDHLASVEFSPAEIKATILLRFEKSAKAKLKEHPAPTVAEMTLWIAQIGGYTGRTSSGGPPGSITIARGLQKVRAAATALEALGQ